MSRLTFNDAKLPSDALAETRTVDPSRVAVARLSKVLAPLHAKLTNGQTRAVWIITVAKLPTRATFNVPQEAASLLAAVSTAKEELLLAASSIENLTPGSRRSDTDRALDNIAASMGS